MSLANVSLCALLVLYTIRQKWTKPVSALEIPASVHTTPAPSQGPPLHSEGPSSTCPPQRSAMVSLLWGGGRRLQHGDPTSCVFAVLTTRERDIEITQRPQRDSCFLCANVRKRRVFLRDCSNACICVYVCIYVCLSVCACLWGQTEWRPPDSKVLAGSHSFFHSLPSFFCGLVLFSGFCDEKKIVYLSVTYHVCIWGAKYLNTHSVLAIGNLVYSILLL